MPHSLIQCKRCDRCICCCRCDWINHDAPTAREEEYRRRSFERLGLYDVAAMSMALRRLTSPVPRSLPPNAA